MFLLPRSLTGVLILLRGFEPANFELLWSPRLSSADSIIRVFTMSSGILMTDATELAVAALIAVMEAVSGNDLDAVTFCSLVEWIALFRCSYIESCIAHCCERKVPSRQGRVTSEQLCGFLKALQGLVGGRLFEARMLVASWPSHHL